MAARKYEVSLGVLKNISTMFRECSICYINTNESPNHFTLIVFCRERRDLLCNVAIATVIFSRVKITCYFHM